MTDPTPMPTPTQPEGLTDEQLKNIWETGHLPTDQEMADDDGENDLEFMFTSAYYRWLDENPEEQEKHDAKCLRAVFDAGVSWSRAALATPPAASDTTRVDALRTALREVIEACGGLATAEVSDEFLCLAPGEVRAQLAKAQRAAPPAATREAGPVPQVGLTDEQLLELMPQQFRDDLATVSRLASYGTPVGPGLYRVSLNTGALAFARAVLARWGGAAVQPVPVSERPWERPGWLDADGLCWVFVGEVFAGGWVRDDYPQNFSHTVCLPHWALPVPAADKGEVQGNG